MGGTTTCRRIEFLDFMGLASMGPSDRRLFSLDQAT